MAPASKPDGRPRGACARLVAAALTAAALTAAVLASPAAQAREPQRRAEPTVALSALPAEAAQVHRVILAGGPFPHARDGAVFFNRERKLPAGERGWYREYTVPTPGARDRGARRIVCGGRIPTAPRACWYTADHYASFSRIHP